MFRNAFKVLPVAGVCAFGVATAWWLNHSGNTPSPLSVAVAKEVPVALSNDEWRAFRLVEKKAVTSNTYKFRFVLPDEKQRLGLTVASCLLTRAPIGELQPDNTKKMVIRPYTPVSLPDQEGYFDMIVKVYDLGNMSKHFGVLKVGDTVDFKGPLPKLSYKANMKKKIGMIAGGSGITPMLQIVQEILRHPEDKTEVSLLFANRSEEDIILRKELDDFAAKHPNFKVHYMVDKSSNPEWKHGVGYIDKDVLATRMPKPSEDSLILVCGPPPLMNSMSGIKTSPRDQGPLTGYLKDLGYTSDMVYKF